MAVEVVVEQQVATRTGTIVLPEVIQPLGQEVEIILQPIPTGTNILGLKVAV